MFIVQKIISFAKRLEDPKYPLLGPNLKGLYVFGLWRSGSKSHNMWYNFVHFCYFLFVISQFIELWIIRHNYLEALHNLSLTALGMICFFKAISFVYWQSDWKELVESISNEELTQVNTLNDTCLKVKVNYTTYARIVTYLSWNIVVSTNITMVTAPFLKYGTSPEYREQIKNGTVPLPKIISSWCPFSKTTMTGYSVAIFIDILANIQGGGVIAVYDSNAFSIMAFLKGQLSILKNKCKLLFDDYDKVDRKIILNRIKECHRHHNVILRQSLLLNSLLSPVMFLYVLVCSGMICCSVIQFTYPGSGSDMFQTSRGSFFKGGESRSPAVERQLLYRAAEPPSAHAQIRPARWVSYAGTETCRDRFLATNENATATQKVWVLQYTTALVCQLFLYCWHSNEVTVEAQQVDGGLYESAWWQCDVRVRKQLALLGGKLTRDIAFSAGPFATLCLATFIDIIKGSYSFFTLLTQMQDK